MALRSRVRPFRLGPPYGGVNKQLSEYILTKDTATVTDNWVLRNKGLCTAFGWEKFTDQVLTDGEASASNLTTYLIEEFAKTDGSRIPVLITDRRAYYFDDDTSLWIPFTKGATPVSTTVTIAVNAGDTTINVASTTGMTAGEDIILGFDTTDQEYLVIDSLTATTIDVSRPSWAPSGTGTQRSHSLGVEVQRVASMVFDTDITQVDSTQDNDVYYFTDGVNPPQKWTGTSWHVDLPGLDVGDDVEGIGTLTSAIRAKQIEVFSDFMVLGNLTEEGSDIETKIRWSQINDYETWANNADGTGQAGSFRFDGPGAVNKLKQFKQDMTIYRKHTIESMSYIGLPEIFLFRRVDTDTGLIATNAFVDRGDVHSFLGPRNIYEFNGVNVVPIGDPIKDDFFDNVNPTQLENSTLKERKETNDLMLFYSTADLRVHDKIYMFHTRLRKWSGPRDVDASAYGSISNKSSDAWDDFTETWDDLPPRSWNSSSLLTNAPLPLLGNDDGLVFVLDATQDGDGTTLTKRYESKRLDLGNANLLKNVQMIRIGADIDNSATISVYLGQAFSESDDISWDGPYNLTLTSDYHPFVYLDGYGRYFKVRIDTTGITTIQDVELHFYNRSEC